MTTLAHRAALRRPRNGGVAARRAVVRWAGRMFRREWRQQLLVLTLLTVAVTAAIVHSMRSAMSSAPPLLFVPVGSNAARLFGMDAKTRACRLAT